MPFALLTRFNWRRHWCGAEIDLGAAISSGATRPFPMRRKKKALLQSGSDLEISMSADPTKDSKPFLDFARVAEQVAATTKRNEKAAILGAYFGELSDRDLQTAAPFFAGHLFPL